MITRHQAAAVRTTLYIPLMASIILWTVRAESAPLPDQSAHQNTTIKIFQKKSISLIGNARYPDHFQHYDYINPDAPKGGTLKLASIGTFDSLNQYSSKGKTPEFLFLLYDRLMTRSQDEPYSLYPQAAESVEYPEDFSWVIFHLNPEARFHDGSPMTADDLVFIMELMKKHSSLFIRNLYKDIIQYQALDRYRVKFNIEEKNRTLKAIALLAYLPVLPMHFWQGKDFSRSNLTIPLGSGPMKIEKIDPGRSITYKRVKDYWGADLPANRGQFNFDRLCIDFYRDNHAALEAFAAGAFDLRIESDPKNWHQKYNFPAVRSGEIIKEDIALLHPHGMSALIFNTRRTIFKDRRVRLALNYLFDFQWTNKALLHSDYQRSTSYFVNTNLAATGLPTDDELELLKTFQQQLPQEVFIHSPYQPESDGSGINRKNRMIAIQLLKDAGWEIRKGHMVHQKHSGPLRGHTSTSNSFPKIKFIL